MTGRQNRGSREDGGGHFESTRRSFLAGFGIQASCVLGVDSTRSAQATDQGRITVGGSLPLSGPLKKIGVPLYRGLRLWTERVNAGGDPFDGTVALDIVDDEGKPDVARKSYRSLVESSDLLVAPYGSRATKAVIDVVESAGVPCVASTAGDRRLWQSGRAWTVQMLNPVDTFLHGALDASFRAGARSIAFVHRDDAFTQSVMKGALEKAREQGWNVLDVVVYGSESEAKRVMRRFEGRSPHLLVGAGFRPGASGGGFLPDALALSRAYWRSDVEANLVCWSIGASFPEYADALGERADLVTGVTGWKPYVEYPDNEEFVRRYANRWGASPDAHAAQGYAAGQVFETALRKASRVTPTRIRDRLFELETKTVFGRYRVNRRGLQVGKENAVVQWQAATPIVVWPEQWQSGALVYPADRSDYRYGQPPARGARNSPGVCGRPGLEE